MPMNGRTRRKCHAQWRMVAEGIAWRRCRGSVTGARMGRLRKRVVLFSVVYVAVAIAALWLAHRTFFAEVEPRPVAYSELLTQVRAGRIASVEVRENEIVAQPRRPAGQSGGAAPRAVVA